MQIKHILTFFAFTFCHYCLAQDVVEYKSWNPVGDEVSYIGGQAWQDELQNPYDRLPARAEKQVRKAVWDLSKNSAGLKVNFRTDANEIIVKYAVSGKLEMPHMPATGVSGIDLYAKDKDGKWIWSAGKYSFGDTITYRFINLNPSKAGREYTLYLPLYNTVKWMDISVPTNNSFVPSLPNQEKPIIVYGTSIAQGACATRPGLAWTNILERRLDHPLINLAFSGNGKLEGGVLDLIAEKEARIYVLDCLPNLTGMSIIEFKKLVNGAISSLKSKQPTIPILLTEHDGYTDEDISLVRKEGYQKLNTALKEVYDSLSSKGIQGIYLLSKEAIGQDIESMVDGVHPNDIGMMNYADAYEKKLREIFSEPIGEISTTVPVTQYRDAPLYFWNERHLETLDYSRIKQPNIVFFGNSIVHFWGGNPIGPQSNGKDSWQRYFGHQSVVVSSNFVPSDFSNSKPPVY